MMRSLVLLAMMALLTEALRRSSKVGKSDASPDCFSPYDGKPLVIMTTCSSLEQAAMLSKAQDCTILSDAEEIPNDGSCAERFAVCSTETLDQLQQEFADQVLLVQPDAGAYYREMSGTAQPSGEARDETILSFYRLWRDYDARMGRVDSVVESSGGIAKLEVAGKSLEGRDMKVVRFTGKGYAPGKPKVVILSNIHAREWMAGMAGVYAVEKLVEKVKGNPGYLDGMEVVILPMANPDGFIHSQGLRRFHRKNMNKNNSRCVGTDLNRNFPFQWAPGENECADNFPGRGPVSEPETQVVKSLMDESKMTLMLDIHAIGQLILTPWGYTTDDNPRQAEYRDLGGKMKRAIEGRHGAKYTEGPVAQVLYTGNGGSIDYVSSIGALGFCFELRPTTLWGPVGFAPPPSLIRPAVEECFDGITTAIEYAKST